MKLTAPPPLPPEPTPESTPSGESPASPLSSEPPIPIEKAPAKQATWPAWFGSADWVLAALVLALAFLAASFAAKNSDVWVHLGAGKMLTTGEYKLGSDPFSYAAADRTWVNHSWLFDLGSFLLYRGDGFLLVLVKALAVAAAFGLILAIRRAGQPLWPWTLLTALAILASTYQFPLRPFIGSMFFLALTLFLVFRFPNRPGSWRLPIAIGITFCLWSNVDAWFLVGPATLSVLLLGEALRQNLWPTAAAEIANDPLGALPDLGTLLKATLVGFAACMLNPHHIGIWELPFELFGAEAVKNDPRFEYLFMAPIRFSSTSPMAFWSSPHWGGNVNGLAYGLLLASGVYAAFLSGAVGRLFGPVTEIDPLPLPHAMLWVGFAALSLATAFAIPLFALVTIPLVASRWNLLSGRWVLRAGNDRLTRLLLTGSAGGRVFTGIALLVLGLAAWPGWLNTPASCWWDTRSATPAYSRRVAWNVEADVDLQRTAEWLQDSRASGRLPAESRGILTSLDLANYCAWFAPSEKVFVNGRFNHHRKDLADFTQIRLGLGLYLRSEAADPQIAVDVLKRWDASYVGVAVLSSETENAKLPVREAEVRMWLDRDHWSAWYFTGRAGLSGWRSSPTQSDPSFHRLALSSAELAFGRDVKLLPAVATRQPIQVEGLWEEFLQPRRTTPIGAEEAIAWLRYKAIQRIHSDVAQLALGLLQLNQPGIALPAVGPAHFQARNEILERQNRLLLPAPTDGNYQAIPILALRAARRAIAENPDHPDGYFALALVLSDPDFPIPETDRAIAQVTAYRQCLIRLPPPAEFKRNFFIASPTRVAHSLARLYLGQRFPQTGDYQGLRVDSHSIGERAGGTMVYGMQSAGRPLVIRLNPAQRPPAGEFSLATGLYVLPLDIARTTLDLANQYAQLEFSDPTVRSNLMKELDEERKQVDSNFKLMAERFRTQAERAPKLRDRHGLALSLGLVGDAIENLKNADLGKEFGETSPELVLHLIALQLALGRLEDASEYIAKFREELSELAEKGGAMSQKLPGIRRRLAEIEFHKLVLEGNYAEAGREFENLFGEGVGKYSPQVDLTRPDMRGFDPAKLDERPYLIFGDEVWPAFAMFASFDSPFGLIPSYLGAHVQVMRHSIAQDVVNRMRGDADFFSRRGFLSLLEGDIEGARTRFQLAKRPPPPGWNLPAIQDRLADQYLRHIEVARKKR